MRLKLLTKTLQKKSAAVTRILLQPLTLLLTTKQLLVHASVLSVSKMHILLLLLVVLS